MNATRLENGHLLVPVRLEGDDGFIGEGMLEIDEAHPDFAAWEQTLPLALDTRAYETALAAARLRLGITFTEDLHPRDLEGQFRKGHSVVGTLSGGFNEDKPKLVKLADNEHAVVKNHMHPELADKDVLAAKLARALGTDITVDRTSETQTVASFIDGKTGGEVTGAGKFAGIGIPLPTDILDNPGAKEMAVLDWLIDNKDRNGTNWMVQPDGTIVPLDHDKASFDPTRGTEGGGKKGDWELVPHNDFVMHHLGLRVNKYGEMTGLKPKITKDELVEVRKALESVRMDFEAAKRSEWYDQADRRLQMLEKKVKK